MSETDTSEPQETESIVTLTETADDKVEPIKAQEEVTGTPTENPVEGDTQEVLGEVAEEATESFAEDNTQEVLDEVTEEIVVEEVVAETPQEMADRNLRECQTTIINSEGPPLRVTEESYSILPAESEETQGPPDTSFGFGNPDQKGFLQLIKYYYEHPEEKPPLHIKRMVGLLRLHKEDVARREARREAGYDTDESSDLFYASDESVEYSSELFEGIEGKDQDPEETPHPPTPEPIPKSSTSGRGFVSSSKCGIRMPNCYIRDRCLRDIDIANLRGNHLQIHLRRRHCGVEIVLPTDYDGNEILKSLESWVETHE